MFFDGIEWDEHNLDHACRRATAEEIEQVITNAATWRRHRHYADRVMFTDSTDGGKPHRPLRRRPPPGAPDYRMGGETMSDPGANASDRELADYYDHAPTEDDWGEPEPIDKSERLEVTLSVRFTPAEIAAVRSRAAAAGLKPTSYIRQSVLAAEQAPVDRARLARTVDALSRDLDELRRAAS